MKFAVPTVTVTVRACVAVIPFSIVPMTSLLPREAIGYAEEIKIDFLDGLRGLPIKGGWGHHPSHGERGGGRARYACIPFFLPSPTFQRRPRGLRGNLMEP